MEKGANCTLNCWGQHNIATVRYTQPERLSKYNTRLHRLLKKLPLCAVEQTIWYIQPNPDDGRRPPLVLYFDLALKTLEWLTLVSLPW